MMTTPKELSAFDQKTMELAEDLAAAAHEDMLVLHATPGGKPHDPSPDIEHAREALRAHLASRPEASALDVLRELVACRKDCEDGYEYDLGALDDAVDAAARLISAAPKAEEATSAAQGLTDAELAKAAMTLMRRQGSTRLAWGDTAVLAQSDAALASQDARRDGGREGGNG